MLTEDINRAWQRYATISISPFDLEITLQAMTSEKLQFKLPSVFTIGADDQPDSLIKYARILTETTQDGSKRCTMPKNGSHVQDIVRGIIEGETRVIVSQMTMEEIFRERQVFKTHVIESVQKELDQFGKPLQSFLLDVTCFESDQASVVPSQTIYAACAKAQLG